MMIGLQSRLRGASIALLIVVSSVPIFSCSSSVSGRYTTDGQNIIDPVTGQATLLIGFGLGGWLLPEGYMWGIRTLDRPRQFEAAIEELVGKEDAATFWSLYRENFVTAEDFRAMAAFGANSVRIPLLASQLQPRDNQPEAPPFVYAEEEFRFLDSVVVWAERYDLGVIWDMHGAPGSQNAENISDSDGEARLWTEKERYWPRLNELWYRIAERYRGNRHIIGYDLLNEPLLTRYDGVSPGLLRQLYVELTTTIRSSDPEGLIFVEGDDWAQEFSMLEPIDWDPHLVLAFHSYPPTSSSAGLKRWDDLRQAYDIPLWHGETGEQGPPYDGNRRATALLNSENVSWNWWTHKKLDRRTQPWICTKSDGFQDILNFWMGTAVRPSREAARDALFEMARQTRSNYCEFSSQMVASLAPLDPEPYLDLVDPVAPEIVEQPASQIVDVGSATQLEIRTRGIPLKYDWTRNGTPVADVDGPILFIVPNSVDDSGAVYEVTVSNDLGAVTSLQATVTVNPFQGATATQTIRRPIIDGKPDNVWKTASRQAIARPIAGSPPAREDLTSGFRLLRDDMALFLLVEVVDPDRIATDPRDYHNDGIEVYLDADNSKSHSYGEEDYMLRFNVGQDLIIHQGELLGEIEWAVDDYGGGYRIEIAIPWAALRSDPYGPFVGFDVHVNDNDLESREHKLSWHSAGDNAYQRPSVFGTVALSPGRGQ